MIDVLHFRVADVKCLQLPIELGRVVNSVSWSRWNIHVPLTWHKAVLTVLGREDKQSMLTQHGWYLLSVGLRAQ